jgi:hypothetical protein
MPREWIENNCRAAGAAIIPMVAEVRNRKVWRRAQASEENAEE